jgi:hypothetical protein
MDRIGILCALLMCAAPAAAQDTGPAAVQHAVAATAPSTTTQDASGEANATSPVSGIVNAELLVLSFPQAPSQQTVPPDVKIPSQTAPPEVKTPSQPVPPPKPQQGFQWAAAFKQYLIFLTAEHLYRLPQERTHSELSGPFWADYVESVSGLHGWMDIDEWPINFVNHPIMGAVTGYVQVQNDPAGRCVEFGKSKAYWRSRGWALVAAAIYSTQFELGPFSEASIGNVGLKAGTMAWVDLVVTPVVGTGMIIAEDVIDRYLVAKVEGRVGGVSARILRSILSPNRSIANLLRFQVPWKRDARSLPPRGSKALALPGAPGTLAEVSIR